jgi:magnesium-dependent phosphatase-1
VSDKYGYQLSFYKDVEYIFDDLKKNGVLIVSASRTHAPPVARKLLRLLHINSEPAIEQFDHMEWGTFSKKKHITSALAQFEGLDFTDVVLYDDEMRNRDVETLGCVFAHVPDEQYGLTRRVYESGLNEWRKRKGL